MREQTPIRRAPFVVPTPPPPPKPKKLPPSTTQQVELDHSIGYSGKIVDSVHLHPNLKEFILKENSQLLVDNWIKDYGKQLIK